MSSSLSSIEHNDYVIDGQRDWQADGVTHSLEGADSESYGAGLRTKIKRFWKKARIPAVMKKFVAGSKSLLSRLTPRFTPHGSPPEPMQTGDANAALGIERVKFPEDMIPSPTSSSNVPSPAASDDAPNLNIHLNTSVHASSFTAIPAPIPTIDDSVNADRAIPSEIADEKSFSDFRYKEKLDKQKSFPEIELGVVSSRVKWLEPLMSGKTAVERNSSQEEDGISRDTTDGKMEEVPQALEIHASSGLAPKVDEGNSEGDPKSYESDDESVFDDSPRLYRHRLPEEEPKPWVEPGTVARGARWLQPVMSEEKRTGNSDSDAGGPTSPTRIVRVVFR